MRGSDTKQATMLSLITPEHRVPKEHPLQTQDSPPFGPSRASHVPLPVCHVLHEGAMDMSRYLGCALVLVCTQSGIAGATKTVAERAAEYDASVLMTVVETYPDLPIANSFRKKKGPPKTVVIKQGDTELARETLDPSGVVTATTGSIPDGPVRMYYTSIQMARELFYKNNVRHGPDKSFDRNGKVIGEATWSNGKPVGMRRQFEVDTGRLLREELWKDGELTELKTFWVDAGGKQRSEESFAGGKAKSKRYFDLDGRPISEKAWAVLDDPEIAKKSGPVVHQDGSGNGERCMRDEQCRSGRCVQDGQPYCGAKKGFRMDLGPGQHCARHSWCASGVCEQSSRCR
ncbi:MAG: hypothetical protein IT381_15800 [Deltaproteobacteria bacterium]|nr:hypothetical protein [Deltaproteobacteria bacterium]